MTNKIRLMDALTTYTGEQDSLAAFIAVATEEIGENWVSRIYDELPDLVPELKEKLDHAYHYYGATMAWGEVQEYLTQTEPLNISDIEDRIPTLEYWLNFFGENGTAIITLLREKLKSIAASYISPSVMSAFTAFSANEKGKKEYILGRGLRYFMTSRFGRSPSKKSSLLKRYR